MATGLLFILTRMQSFGIDLESETRAGSLQRSAISFDHREEHT
ncbi:hypothetical protein SAMN04487894_103405 [Niabella drilacis]|uniref:Uncharacterized protein n=1 Tax=Niabella drilacis (strain DSM 25811 / CCM 8410 / CCUG 62505 / LMG 26954 / E90) TaxID=1285928 RepID=A0A1G6NV65_NIADE|nr:hypothetical protein SAMN04487894_103405 [Niabella drilacis]